jgi:hypothetical protein
MIDSQTLATVGLPPTRLFEGFPYLVTRVVPTMYHVILIPDLRAEDLVELARHQAHANHLPTSLVLQVHLALYIGTDACESWGDSPPTGGIIVTERLQPCRTFPQDHALTARRLALGRFVREASPRHGYMFGDLNKSGRKPTLEEEGWLAGTQSNGVPRGSTPAFAAASGRGGAWIRARSSPDWSWRFTAVATTTTAAPHAAPSSMIGSSTPTTTTRRTSIFGMCRGSLRLTTRARESTGANPGSHGGCSAAPSARDLILSPCRELATMGAARAVVRASPQRCGSWCRSSRAARIGTARPRRDGSHRGSGVTPSDDTPRGWSVHARRDRR